VNTKLLSLKSLTLAVLLCATVAAQADIVVYTSRDAFLAAVAAPGIDTFDDLSVIPYTSPLDRIAGPYHYRAESGPNGNFFPGGVSGDTWLSTNFQTDAMTFTNFSAGVRAVGGNFFGSDVAGAFQAGQNMVLSATAGGVTETIILTNTTLSTFLGFVSTSPLTSVVARTDGGSYWPTANDLTLALAPIPEPASYAMLLAGLCLLGGLARRRPT
jgi:hypothetical protein